MAAECAASAQFCAGQRSGDSSCSSAAPGMAGQAAAAPDLQQVPFWNWSRIAVEAGEERSNADCGPDMIRSESSENYIP